MSLLTKAQTLRSVGTPRVLRDDLREDLHQGRVPARALEKARAGADDDLDHLGHRDVRRRENEVDHEPGSLVRRSGARLDDPFDAPQDLEKPGGPVEEAEAI